jgi:hypothetical protein
MKNVPKDCKRKFARRLRNCKKVEESFNKDEVKLEMKVKIEQGRQNFLDGITLQPQKGERRQDSRTSIEHT